MIVIFVAYCSFCRGGTFCQGNFLLEKLFDYHRDILHWRTCCQWFDFPFKRLQERFLVMAEKKSVLSNITGNLFIFCFRPPCLKMRILRIWFWLWRKMGGFEGGLIRAGEVSEAVPSLATAARSARESVTLQSAECSVAGSSSFYIFSRQTNQPMGQPSEVGGVGKWFWVKFCTMGGPLHPLHPLLLFILLFSSVW